jgi:[acyl-carrier-protein] S-malonyltransferase
MGIAWVFPGQGSQKVGMAAGVIELPQAQQRFNLASELLGRDLLAICHGQRRINRRPERPQRHAQHPAGPVRDREPAGG